MLPSFDLSILAALVCIGLALAILTSCRLPEKLTQLLCGYFVVGIFWELSLAWDPTDRSIIAQWVTAGCSVVMGVLYGRLAEFDRERLHPIRRWIVVAGCLIVLLPGLLSLSEYLEWRDPNWIETWTVQMLAGVAWFIFAVDGIITIVKSVPTSWTTVLVYWGVAFIATGAGVGSVLCDEGLCEQLSSAWHMLGVVATALAVFSVNRVESRSTFRHLFVYIAGTLLTGIVLISILLIAPGIFSGSRLLFGVIITSGILGVAYQVLHRVIRETIDRFLFGHAVDYAKHLNTLAGRVRNVLDPEQLAEIMMITVQESLGVDRGALLVGDTGDDEIRDVTFQVVGHLEHKVSESPKFRAFSPFMDDLRRRGLTLTQDVLDADPRFQAVREHEREWLKSLGMHLFVPLRSRGQLIGIFALGQKKGGKAYEADEIEFLIEVANRSGYTLDNARLFDYMRTLNAVFDRLYTDLDEVNRRLQEMDKLKSAFISVITHELRSPLVGIDFSLQLLKRQEWDKLAPEQQEPIRDIDNGFGQLKSMIDNLVAFAAFLSKQGELRKEEIDFALVLQETIAPLEMMAQTRQMVLRVQMPDRLPCIWADKERISEAMYHLVHNAIKFNRPQGQIEISCAADQEVIRFQVTDTGSGVEAEKLETIWDSFSQSADTLRRGVEGLGLGLALVKYIVSAHGGEVWANSRPNQGSTFGFQIPLGQPERSAIDQVSLMLSDRDQLLKR